MYTQTDIQFSLVATLIVGIVLYYVSEKTFGGNMYVAIVQEGIRTHACLDNNNLDNNNNNNWSNKEDGEYLCPDRVAKAFFDRRSSDTPDHLVTCDFLVPQMWWICPNPYDINRMIQHIHMDPHGKDWLEKHIDVQRYKNIYKQEWQTKVHEELNTPTISIECENDGVNQVVHLHDAHIYKTVNVWLADRHFKNTSYWNS